MSDATFSRPGAVDLSQLATAAPGSTNSYVMNATEADFQELATKSTRHPVIVEFYSQRDTSGGVAAALAALVDRAQGKYLLARVDVDAEPRLAQGLGVQAVPTVVALIGGQLAPLFQGTKERAEIEALLDQVSQLAVANGITSKADPISQGAPQTEEPVADPRFEAADAALEAGDYQKAVAEFDKLLQATPGDAEVIAGRAQAALLMRSLDFDVAQIQAAAAANPEDLDAQLAAADLEIIQGHNEAAFERLLGLATGASPEAKEQLRVRILELFEVVGRTDPLVLKARRRLASLLF